MPEYLAPAVYVEETSFRAKSIEGVSTSTTGFAGPLRRGPFGETPELVTSFAEFARIFGGLGDLVLKGSEPPVQTNYLAHAVRAYFNEGGSRLFVARVREALENDDGEASCAIAQDGQLSVGSFVARFPGSAGNGTILVRKATAPAGAKMIENAPDGTMAVAVSETKAAIITSSLSPPFAVEDQSTLVLTVEKEGATESHTITFKGTQAELISNPIAFDPAKQNRVKLTGSLEVEISGFNVQVFEFPAPDYTAAEIVALIGPKLSGGYAYISDDGRLHLGTHRAGLDAAIQVASAPTEIVFQSLSATPAPATNNVANLDAVTFDELSSLVKEQCGEIVSVHLTPGDKRLALTTSLTKLTIGDGSSVPKTANVALGFPLEGGEAEEQSGGPVYYVRQQNAWGTKDNADTPPAGAKILTVTVLTIDGDGEEVLYEGLGLHPAHPHYIGRVLSKGASSRAEHISRLFAINITADESTNDFPFTLLAALTATDEPKQFPLAGGHDGGEPSAGSYSDALNLLGGVEDISIIAAPGSSAYGGAEGAQSVRNELIIAAEKRRAYRIAVLEAPVKTTATQVRELRAEHDSSRAALYYPWVVVPNPLARPGEAGVAQEIALPPSGYVCGIYARSDIERGVWKAPANEVVRSALRFEVDVNFAQQEVLNPAGVNCLRYLSGRGYRVWGARTMTSDPEWKYVNVRRYFNYLERSIDVGTQWAVFEPNGERLWVNIRETIGSFLYNEWRSGALLGDDPKQAFFVRCDRSTMTQNDLDNGRLICLVGVAVVKPAEFVIFRIGQKTADARN